MNNNNFNNNYGYGGNGFTMWGSPQQQQVLNNERSTLTDEEYAKLQKSGPKAFNLFITEDEKLVSKCNHQGRGPLIPRGGNRYECPACHTIIELRDYSKEGVQTIVDEFNNAINNLKLADRLTIPEKAKEQFYTILSAINKVPDYCDAVNSTLKNLINNNEYGRAYEYGTDPFRQIDFMMNSSNMGYPQNPYQQQNNMGFNNGQPQNMGYPQNPYASQQGYPQQQPQQQMQNMGYSQNNSYQQNNMGFNNGQPQQPAGYPQQVYPQQQPQQQMQNVDIFGQPQNPQYQEQPNYLDSNSSIYHQTPQQQTQQPPQPKMATDTTSLNNGAPATAPKGIDIDPNTGKPKVGDK